jgi:hypothetical protein
MPDLAFPLVGHLGFTSPPSPVLCSATTTICPSRYPMLSLGHRYLVSTTRCLCPLFKLVWNRSSSPDAGAVCSTGSPLSSGFARQETNGSPKFPGYPFCVHAPLSDPGGVLSTRLSALRTAAFHSFHSVGFPTKKTGGYPLRNTVSLSTIIQISRLNHAACTLAYPGFGLPLPDLPARLPGSQGLLPAPSPLRTALESFQSYGSSLSKRPMVGRALLQLRRTSRYTLAAIQRFPVSGRTS